MTKGAIQAAAARSAMDVIDKPDEDVVLDRAFTGRIRCRGLTVSAGSRVRAAVQASNIVVEGHLSGIVRAEEMYVALQSTFDGECHATSLKAAGTVSGLIHAGCILVKKSAVLSGVIVADEWGQEVGARVRAESTVEPGASKRRDLLDLGRRSLAEQGRPVEFPDLNLSQATRSPGRLPEQSAPSPASALPVPAAAPPPAASIPLSVPVAGAPRTADAPPRPFPVRNGAGHGGYSRLGMEAVARAVGVEAPASQPAFRDAVPPAPVPSVPVQAIAQVQAAEGAVRRLRPSLL